MNPRIREAARRRGVPVRRVAEAWRMLREEAAQKADRERELRKAVWYWYAWTLGCRDFWRHGMWRKFPRAFSDGDATLIPNFDVVAQCLSPQFPEYLGGNNAAAGDDPSARLFSLLSVPCPRLPTAYELAELAGDIAAAAETETEESLETPF